MLGPGPRLIKKIIYRAAVSQRLRNTGVDGVVTRLRAGRSGVRIWAGGRHVCRLQNIERSSLGYPVFLFSEKGVLAWE